MEPVLVDTNVLSDVLFDGSAWREWSLEKITEYHGRLTINPLIYAELCYKAESQEEVEMVVEEYSLTFKDLPRKALFLCSRAYRAYRERGGVKTAPLPDFFIGAHAEALSIPILTRDTDRYQTYFPNVPLICP